MKTLLINPATPRISHNIGAMAAFPLGLAYIAAMLERQHEVQVIDEEVSGPLKLSGPRPDVVGITANSLAFQRAMDIALMVKARDRRIIVVVGGGHANVWPDYPLKYECCDIVVHGEGEITAAELWARLEKGAPYDDMPGIAYRNRGNEIVVNPARALIDDLDTLPFPARHLFPISRYRQDSHLSARPVFSAGTSRGCPFSCRFCSHNVVFGRRYRARSPKNVVDEIEEIIAVQHAKAVYFRDDTFTVDKQRVLGICEEIRRRRLDFVWECESRVDTIDEEMIVAMKAAGCEVIWCGLESGSQRILDSLGKGITLEQVKETYGLLHKHGIRTRAMFMIGIPGETMADIETTAVWAQSLGIGWSGFSIFTGFPTSPMYREVLEKGLCEKDAGHGVLIIKTPEFDKVLLEAVQAYIIHAVNKVPEPLTWQGERRFLCNALRYMWGLRAMRKERGRWHGVTMRLSAVLIPQGSFRRRVYQVLRGLLHHK